jgi:hypothetical protein
VVRERSFDAKISKPLWNSEKENVSVAQVLSTIPLNVSFRRALVGDNWDMWLNLVGDVLMVNLNDRKDSFIWTANKNFSVKNMYNDVVLRAGTPVSCWVWKAKIPLKIKIFLWYPRNGVVLTKDNLVKRQWKGCKNAAFVRSMKQFNTSFFDCPMATLMWGGSVLLLVLRNRGMSNTFLVLDLEVFRKSKGILC